jgi:uncharacterized membrane protein YkvA (DUF1232 family)
MEQNNFDEYSFWQKIIRHSRKAGVVLIEKALTLYYSFRDPDTPTWAKTVIAGALAYFILPIDAIPDFIPVVGFTDDLAALISAMTTVSLFVKEEHKLKAKEKLKNVIKL